MSRTTYSVELYIPGYRDEQLPATEILWTFKNATDAMLCFGGLHWHLSYEESLKDENDIYLIMTSNTVGYSIQCMFIKIRR